MGMIVKLFGVCDNCGRERQCGEYQTTGGVVFPEGAPIGWQDGGTRLDRHGFAEHLIFCSPRCDHEYRGRDR